jgi:molecular chaperone DnaK
MTMAIAVGIDLGTTNTVIAAVNDGVARSIPGPTGARLIPSVVSFPASGGTLVGEQAHARRLHDPANTIYSVKRLIGRVWASSEVQDARAKLPFELRAGPGGSTAVAARGETFSLLEISALILKHAKALAEAHLGEPVERAVVTVPANFNDLQRAATKTAGRIASLEVLRILNEPTAAALAYGPQEATHERIAVYDLGGGTFDVTVLDVAGSVFEVLATAGDTALGGDDIDVLIAERMAEDLLTNHFFDARADPIAFSALRMLAEQMKRRLSARDEDVIAVDDLVPGEAGARVPWRFRMTRSDLESAARPLIERTLAVCEKALAAAGCEAGQLDRIILVGGATRMPMVGRDVEEFFGRPPIVRINPDEVVALGAAIQASLLDKSKDRAVVAAPRISEDSIVDASEFIDVEDVVEDSPRDSDPPPGLPVVVTRIVGANTLSKPIPPLEAPKPAPLAEVVASREPLLSVRPTKTLVFDVPSLAPALPSARPAAPAQAASSFAADPPAAPGPPRASTLLIDVTPLSLGVETVGGFSDRLIDANTPVPCDRMRAFTTASHGQTSVTVRVAQGESKRFDENTYLGEVELSGLTPAPRGETQIEVTFVIDPDGILDVRARDRKTGREQTARLHLAGAAAGSEDIDALRARLAAYPPAAAEHG